MAAALIFSVSLAVYCLFLLRVGSQIQSVLEGGSLPGIRGRSPSPAAIYPLLASVLIAGGLLTRKRWISWLGLLALSVFAGLFVFGIGGSFIPISAVFLLLLSVIQVNASK